MYETLAPQGYKLDNRTYTVEVAGNETRRVNGGYVEDEPTQDPGVFALRKVDSDKKEYAPKDTWDKPQGEGSLEGAEYELKFYKNDSWSGVPIVRKVATDKKGIVALKDVDFGFGKGVLPLGTFSMKEIKAPKGYKLDSNEYRAKIVTDNHHAWGAKFVWEETDGARLEVDANGQETLFHWEEAPIRGGIAVTKYDADGGTTPQGNCKLEGTKFAVYNVSANEVLSLDGKTMVPPVSVVDAQAGKKAGIVGVIVCDENAVASTGKNTLGYGDYVLLETEAGEGYMNSGWSSDVIEIRTDGQYVEIT